MHNSRPESAISGPINLLKHYSFESNHHSYERVLDSWLERFPLNWVNLALVESLYQGRYKVVSVEQILTLWQRRGQPSYHFNHDFERLVSNNLPQTFEKKERRPHQSPHFRRINANYQPAQIDNQRRKPRNGRLNIFPHTSEITDLPSLSKSRNNPSQTDQDDSKGAESPLLKEEHQQSELSETSLKVDALSAQGQETESEATNPSTMAIEANPVASESNIESDSKLLDPLPEESVENSPPSTSVPMSSSIGEKLNPIHQFVPQSSSPEFCSKLTAMAQVNV